MSVIKNKETILTGTRNQTDNLWDIPIQKNNITQINFQKPPTHPAMYKSRQSSKSSKNKNKNKNGNKIPAPNPQIRPPKPRLLSPTTQQVENVSVKRCAHLVHLQQEEDNISKQYCAAALAPKGKKLAVII